MKKATRLSNETGVRNLCEVASHVLRIMPVNAATTFTVRTLMREAVNKSNPSYRGNDNKKNVRYISSAAVPHLGQKGLPVRFVQIRPLGSISIVGGSCKSASTRDVSQLDSHQIA